MFHNKDKKILCCIIFFLILNLCSCKNIEINLFMFTNIKECQKMIESKSDDVQIQTYDCTIVDENISKYTDTGYKERISVI